MPNEKLIPIKRNDLQALSTRQREDFLKSLLAPSANLHEFIEPLDEPAEEWEIAIVLQKLCILRGLKVDDDTLATIVAELVRMEYKKKWLMYQFEHLKTADMFGKLDIKQLLGKEDNNLAIRTVMAQGYVHTLIKRFQAGQNTEEMQQLRIDVLERLRKDFEKARWQVIRDAEEEFLAAIVIDFKKLGLVSPKAKKAAQKMIDELANQLRFNGGKD